MKLHLRSNFWITLFGLAVLFVYGQTLFFGFVSDDVPYVLGHPALQNSADWRSLWEASFAGLYIPVTYTAWLGAVSISRTFFDLSHGVSAFPFHMLNLLLHFLNACLIFFFLKQRKFSQVAAGLGAVAFLLFPLQLEPVSWVTGLKDVLSAFLGLLALFLFVKAGDERDTRRAGAELTLASLAFFLALLAKPGVISIILMALILLFWSPPLRLRVSMIVLLLWIVVSLWMIYVTQDIQSSEDPILKWGMIPSLMQRFQVALDAMLFYFKKILWPLPLGFDYGRSPDVAISSYAWVGGGMVFLFIILAYLRQSLRPFVLALLVFIAGLLPTLGLIPFQFQVTSTVADRYAYLAALGLAIFVALLIQNIRLRFLVVMLGVVFVFWASIDLRECSNWKTNETLFTNALKTNPQSWFALEALAAIQRMKHDYVGAEQLYRRAIEVQPTDSNAWGWLGETYLILGKSEDAMHCFQRSRELDSESLYVLCERLIAKKNWEAAHSSLILALRINPENEKARSLLVKVTRQLS